MKKSTCLNEIQKRLPDDIIIQDETPFDFTDDEYLSILSWIKYFNEHYRKNGKKEQPTVSFPVISKRLHLDFALYHIPSDTEINRGKHVIYLSRNGVFMDGSVKKSISVKELINAWSL